MRGILLFAAAMGAVLLVPASAGADSRGALRCDATFIGWNDTYAAGAFAGPAWFTECDYWHSAKGGSFGGGATATASGTWTATSCAVGGVAGRITLDFEFHEPIYVDFDVPTTGGAGQGSATVSGEVTGSGPIAIQETVTQTPCPKTILPPTPIDVGPVQGELGAVEREELPAIRASFAVALD